MTSHHHQQDHQMNPMTPRSNDLKENKNFPGAVWSMVTIVTRAVHANSANVAGGALEAKIIFDPGLN